MTLSSEFPDWTPDKILEKTGIIERRIADVNETAADLAYLAAEQLFREHNINKHDIDFLIFVRKHQITYYRRLLA